MLETGTRGITDGEAEKRLAFFGANVIEEKRSFPKVAIFLRALTSPLILVLIVAASVTALIGDWIDTGVIAAAVIINTLLGFYQENKAETALRLLATYIRTRSRVMRGGGEREIDAGELVPGDLIRVAQGDRMPADARILFVNGLEADEAVLTGESLPVAKSASPVAASTALPERTSMMYMGTLVVHGLADAVVTATGSSTEFGKIAELVGRANKESTPLERAITRFTLKIGLILAFFIALLFVLGIWAGHSLFDMFLIAIAITVSAVPEGLPVALTVVLAVGVERLAKRKGVVRRLLAAETLGSTTLILTDKTGTLTQAKMELCAIHPYARDISGAEKELLSRALANTDVVVENPAERPEEWRIFGRAIEKALVEGAAKRGVLLPAVVEKENIIERIPFSSEHKFSVSVLRNLHGHFRTVLLGAPEIILRFTALGEKERQDTTAHIGEYASRGERVIGVASRESNELNGEELKSMRFSGFRFDGLITFRDPLRPGVMHAIKRIGDAGVKTIIATGDHKNTADAIARELGMIDGKGAVLTGDDLKYLTREELFARAQDVTVYARVTPEDKLNLVRMYKEKGEVVAVTGDGVNDAPALQAADIGVAVGSGTDVAKSAADLVLLDDNFETLVAAIEEGRRILDNIRKVIVYLLSDALDELLLIGGALLFSVPLPLNAIQILFVNFFSDSFPALALAFEKGIDGLGERPRRLDRNLFDRTMKILIGVIGVFTSAILFILYYMLLGSGFDAELVKTFIFAAFATYTLFLSFSVRSLEKSIFSYNPFSNRYLVGGVGIGILLTLGAIYIPSAAYIFKTVPLPLPWLAAVLGVGVFNILAIEFGKWVVRRK